MTDPDLTTKDQSISRFTILSETTDHLPLIEELLDHAFGPGRFAKTAYRLRENVEMIPELCLVGYDRGRFCGSLRFWPISVAGENGFLMLGPLAVEPALRGQGLGIGLMKQGLALATDLGFKGVMLVGDEPYYARVGFKAAPMFSLSLPGPVDQSRLLIRSLQENAFEGLNGSIDKPV